MLHQLIMSLHGVFEFLHATTTIATVNKVTNNRMDINLGCEDN